MSVPLAPEPFKGLLNLKKTKDELQRICIALGFQDNEIKKTKETLIGLIEHRLDENPSLAKEPLFIGLSRVQKESKDKGAKRTSADKVAEDLAANSKPSKGLSGYLFIYLFHSFRSLTPFSRANLTLHNQQATTDPVGASAPLGIQLLGQEGRRTYCLSLSNWD